MHDRPQTFDSIPLNKYYKTDIQYTFQLCQWFLKPLGIYPLMYSGATKFERIVSAFLILLCFSVVQFVAVPFGHYIAYHEKGIRDRIKYIGPLSFCLSTSIRYGFLSFKAAAFGRCIEHVKKDWEILQRQDHRVILLKHVTRGKNLSKICMAFLYTGGLFYHSVMPLLSQKKSDNETFRVLSYPGYEAFFDVQKSPNYEIVICIHCVYALLASNIMISTYSLTATFIYHICGQIEIQTLRLKNSTKLPKMIEKNEYNKEDCLTIVVRNHVNILRFAKNVEETLCEICLLEVLLSTMLICFVLYHFVLEWEANDSVVILTYIILIISFVFNILIFCYVGELLLGQGSKIASASYQIEWYDLPGRKARDIVLLLATSKYPPKLTAGKIIVLSLNTFALVMKTSIAYLNLLRTVTEF